MVRLLIGSVLGGIAQFIVGAIAWVGFGWIAIKSASDAANADLQVALARTLSATGTGTYMVPNPETSAGGALLGRGPVALVFFNTGGFPAMKPAALLEGLILSIVMLFLTGLALRSVAAAERLKVAALFAAAALLYFVLSLPVYNFYMPVTWWVFLAVEEAIAFGLGVFVLVKWFMPEPVAPTLH